MAPYTLFSSFKTHHNYVVDVFEEAISLQEAASSCLARADTEKVYKHKERHNFQPRIQPKCKKLRFLWRNYCAVESPRCKQQQQAVFRKGYKTRNVVIEAFE